MERNEELIKILREQNWFLSTAESLTGGWLASEIVSVPGASDVFLEGFVTYSIRAKEETLGVDYETIERYGAVSSETAIEMARGAIRMSGAHVSMSTTGNAGPDISEDKPVGLVFIAVDVLGEVTVKEHHFMGNRNEIRLCSVRAAMEECLDALNKKIKYKA